MRLKSLELQGYKTFALPTEFQFSEKVTAIVGPNGSGKSNIADALRWVLGEQSFSLLRGKKTEDMIFAGSEQRSRASMASATIIFDNSEGWLPIDFTEVAVARRAYRDGGNEYLLNGQRVRLKDVSELLAKSGLAERTYTIIGQGLVDTALSLKADERRRLFEEAAGIGLYRSRREEALRRLDNTRRNLERIQDILSELRPRLRSLERAARRAREYEQISADLRLLLRDWYGFHWHRSQEELSDAREGSSQQEDALEKARQTYAGLEEKLAGSRDQIQGLRARLSSWHRQLSHLHTRRESVSRNLAVADERTRSLIEQVQSLETENVRLAEEFTLRQERVQVTDQEVQTCQSELNDARKEAQAARKILSERQDRRSGIEKELQRVRQELSGLTGRQGQLQARLAERQIQAERQQEALQSSGQTVKNAEKDVLANEANLQTAQQAFQAAEKQCNAVQVALQSHREHLKQAEVIRQQALDARSVCQAEITRLRTQAEVLEQAERALAGYSRGAKLLLEAARQSSIKGVRGALSSLLDVPEAYEVAISAALGHYLDAIVLSDDAGLETALEKLVGQNVRATLLPVGHIVPSILEINDQQRGQLASELVGAPPDLRPVVDLLLGQTWVVTDRAAARNALAGKNQNSALCVVTLKGEVFYANGPVVVGQGETGSTLGRTRQRREIQEKLASGEKQLGVLDDKFKAAEQTLTALQAKSQQLQDDADVARQTEREALDACGQAELNLEKARRQLAFHRERKSELEGEITRGEAETRQISEEITELETQIQDERGRLRSLNASLAELSLEDLQAQVSHWNTRTAVAEQAVVAAKGRQRERQAAFNEIANRQASTQERLTELTKAQNDLEQEKETLRQDEITANQEIEALQVLIEPAEAELATAEKQQETLQATEADARQVLSQSEHYHAQARIVLARRQEALDSLRTRIEDDFGLVAFEYVDDISGPTPLPLEGMVEALPVVKTLPPDIGENIKRQRAQIRRIGAINPEAQVEFEEVQQRHDFLSTQMADLSEAETDIKEVIAELDLLMQREFRKTFDAVAGEFRQTFTRLFGGGSAKLVLTSPDDLTNTGIDIEARLPGRREQGLSLLSGGERSLTAVALVFSLLKVSPTPFCVLDEVDAMLDEANVGRFRDLLAELSQTTQFAVITHNRNTVQVADVIYGITMGHDTASQMISLKLDEVSQVIDVT